MPPYRNKRFLAILAAVITFGAFVTVTQVSNAGTNKRRPAPVAGKPCPPAANGGQAQQAGAGANPQVAPPAKDGDPLPPSPTEAKAPGGTAAVGQNSGRIDGGIQNGRQVWHYPGAQDGPAPATRRTNGKCTPASGGTSASPSGSSSEAPPPPADEPIQDNELLGTNCEDSSRLQKHAGFQDGNRCVAVEHGEVPSQDKAPSVLFVGAPFVVRANQPFVLKVSSRNLKRDRFLAARLGGYYREIALLTADGLSRGHLHTSCELLSRLDQAPDRTGVPAFFVATEDGGGGAAPDVVSINVPGLTRGIYSCGVWAGDPSHRTPMAQRANQRTAFDAIRIVVR